MQTMIDSSIAGVGFVNVDVFIDGSGASALMRVGRHLFAASFAAGRPVVHFCNSWRSPKSVPTAAMRRAEKAFSADVVAHLTESYLAKHRALYEIQEPS